jgi:hypothetical protein
MLFAIALLMYWAGHHAGYARGWSARSTSQLADHTRSAFLCVRALEALRADEVDQSISYLEVGLDASLTTLIAEIRVSPEVPPDSNTLAIWSQLKRYRQAHPTSLSSDKVFADFWQSVPSTPDPSAQ